jgi:dTDP-4-dehydrorhamnose reductase
MRIVVVGRNGQIGWELRRSLLCLGEVIALDRSVIDMSRPETIAPALEQHRPDVVVNASAYTAVDLAESEEALATVVNSVAVGELARAAHRLGALLIHYSTDYVFDGKSSEPYRETSTPSPVNAYGRSKLGGEQAIAQVGGDWLVFRTAWVYGARARNFARTIANAALERDTLNVVADQFGTPTAARTLADSTAHVLRLATQERRATTFESGIFHLTARGRTSWHGFAEKIVAHARTYRGDDIRTEIITPISASEFAAPAARPTYSVLDCSRFDARFDVQRPQWEVPLEFVMAEMWR